MPVTQEQIESFRQFALQMLRNGGAGSMEQCLKSWQQDTERSETIESVRRAVSDLEAGRGLALEEVDAEIRRRFAALG